MEEPLVRGFEAAQFAPGSPAEHGIAGKARPICRLDGKHNAIYPYTL